MRAVGVGAYMVALGLALGAASPASEVASTRRPTVRLEDGLMINSRAAYRFSVPPSWILDDGSTYDLAKIVHPESGAEFSVYYARGSGGTLGMHFMAMKFSLETPEMKWITLGKGFVTLGGSEAVGFRGTREKDGKKIKEIICLALRDGYMYIASATVDLDRYEARAAEIDSMYSSFAWGAPPKSP